MTAIVPDSPALRAALEALPEEQKKQIRAKRHPWLGPRRMLIVSSRTWGVGDQLVAELVERFGSCVWTGGGWTIKRAQLSLFPKGAG